MTLASTEKSRQCTFLTRSKVFKPSCNQRKHLAITWKLVWGVGNQGQEKSGITPRITCAERGLDDNFSTCHSTWNLRKLGNSIVPPQRSVNAITSIVTSVSWSALLLRVKISISFVHLSKPEWCAWHIRWQPCSDACPSWAWGWEPISYVVPGLSRWVRFFSS